MHWSFEDFRGLHAYPWPLKLQISANVDDLISHSEK